MDESANAKKQLETSLDKKSAYLKATNYPVNGNDLTKVPKRKLSVFYRSFDLIAPIDQEKEKETLEFRRTSSSPSVRIERTQENNEISSQTSSYKKVFVDNCRSLIDSDKGLSNSSPDCLSEKCTTNSEVATIKLPQVKEGAIVDDYSTQNWIGKCRVDSNENHENTVDSASTDSSSHPLTSVQSINQGKQVNNERISSTIGSNVTVKTNVFRKNSPETHRVWPHTTNTDLVKIKDSEYPRSYVNASSAGRLGKYTPVDPEMSSHEDSSIGSDSEDDSIERGSGTQIYSRNETDKNEASKKSSIRSHTSACFSTGESSGDLDNEIVNSEKNRDPKELRAKRQKFFAVRRSLSEGDSERYHRARRHCKCIRQELFDETEQFPAFPTFNDSRLQIIGLSNAKDADNVYRENLSENELELKYVAFSIGLSTDRITLQRRMALSLRQRDQSERNFTDEVQKMQEDIQGLSPLCTDRDSIDKVDKIRRRLDMVARCAHGVSCAAETLGAVYQEHRISKAIFIADKYLQILRTRCENLAAEIAEIKGILLKNNIVIEENSGETGDDLPKIRYRNGVPTNNRMIARRRASIATISRPLSSQDVIKEGPRQRNSVSGRVTLRRPSLCSETQRWESEKLNRTDSSNSVVELRDIFEQTESRRNSVEENNNLRTDQSNTVDTVNCNIANDVEAEDRMNNKQNSFLESNVTKTVEKQLKLCIGAGEPLKLPRNFETWRPILWYILIFFLGFYAKQVTSC
nr:PREDICTED: uncharacterized protein LOC100879678 [Megachile rotundata]